MAKKSASRMFMRSISSTEALATAKHSQASCTAWYIASRLGRVSFLESLSVRSASGDLSTAAHATTGPAKGPRPTSSIPTTTAFSPIRETANLRVAISPSTGASIPSRNAGNLCFTGCSLRSRGLSSSKAHVPAPARGQRAFLAYHHLLQEHGSAQEFGPCRFLRSPGER